MDFFEAQARAKKRTSRLVLLFALAVIGTILAAYAAALLGVHILGERASYEEYGYTALTTGPALWQPKVFASVSLGVLTVVGLASLFKWSQFSAGGSAVAESVNGRRVAPQTTDLRERRLLNVVEEMAIASGTPVPAVFILDDEPGINAFAAGLTTSDAVVAVTRGTLEKLNRDELQGVIAHEFSHILNGDMRLNLRLTSLLFGILVLGLAGRGILWSLRHTRTGRSSRNSKGSGGFLAVILFAGLALLIIGYVGYFFGRIIQAAVSRQREYLADAAAVQFTRNPLGVTGALKKIGGYALGSRLQTSKAAAIGHFFFAQSFRSGITGLWSTHPPLPERIRAIDPHFDGQMFEPPQTVDVARESFVSAGLHPPKLEPKNQNSKLQTFSVPAAIAAVGTLTAEQVHIAEALLSSLPAALRDAARSPEQAPSLLYALLLDSDPAVREKQRALIAQHASPAALASVDLLAPHFVSLDRAQRLPLVQLSAPTLRHLPASTLDPFLSTLDELVHADATVCPFEFALQKVIARALALGRSPRSAIVQYHSFNALSREISFVLSVLARASASETISADAAFAHGAAQLRLVSQNLHYVGHSPRELAELDTALDKLAIASLPIKHRTLLAAAHVVSADPATSIAELELLRAIAAALDLPMPPPGPP